MRRKSLRKNDEIYHLAKKLEIPSEEEERYI